MDAAQLTSLVGTVGFPIVVAAYLLLRMEATVGKLRDSVDELVTELKIEHRGVKKRNTDAA